MGTGASKVLHGITSVSKGILHTVGHVITGGMLGSKAGPIGAGVGAIGSGILAGLSQIDPIVSSFRGSNGNVPVKPEDIHDIVNQSADVLKRGSQFINSNPAMQQAISEATRGKISSKLLQMGHYADAAAQGISSIVYKGGMNPTAVEKMASPVLNLASTQLSRRQQKELDKGRTNAMLLSTLNPQTINP